MLSEIKSFYLDDCVINICKKDGEFYFDAKIVCWELGIKENILDKIPENLVITRKLNGKDTKFINMIGVYRLAVHCNHPESLENFEERVSELVAKNYI